MRSRASASATSSGCSATPGIVRHRGKIEATIANARGAVALREAERRCTSSSGRTAGDARRVARRVARADARVEGAVEAARKAGFRFVGPTTV